MNQLTLTTALLIFLAASLFGINSVYSFIPSISSVMFFSCAGNIRSYFKSTMLTHLNKILDGIMENTAIRKCQNVNNNAKLICLQTDRLLLRQYMSDIQTKYWQFHYKSLLNYKFLGTISIFLHGSCSCHMFTCQH